jgi:hypothetical protein
MIHCFHCLSGEIKWHGDFMCDEITGCECGEGIVHILSCSGCEANIQMTVYCKGEE